MATDVEAPATQGRGGNGPPAARPPTAHRRRWPRRVLIGAIVVVLVAIAAAGGGYLYLRNRLGQIKKIDIAGAKDSSVSQPMNILLTGSDSRAGESSGDAQHFGSASQVAGQRSDVIILVHLDPRTASAAMLSIPRDMLVTLAGSGRLNKINVAFDQGPSELVQTISQNFGITVNHYAAVNFQGLQKLTDAVGGVCLNFPYPVRDGSPTGRGNESGLNIPTAGQHVLNGTMALAFVRSRYYQYYKNGSWHPEGTGDIGRIQRQHEYMRALATRSIHEAKHNPLTANAVINRAVNDVTVDSGLSSSDILGLALELRSLQPSGIPSWTMPYKAVSGYRGLGDVLLPEQAQDAQVISQWESYQAPSAKAPGGQPKQSTPSTLAPSQVTLTVLNGSGVQGQAARAATELKAAGFTVTSYSTAAVLDHTASVVSYAPGHQAEARTVAAHVEGKVTVVEDSTLGGSPVVLTTGTDFAGVAGAPATAGGTTSTTAAGGSSSTAPQTNQLPPWDPTVC